MEEILHYVWKFKLYNNDLNTSDGDILEVIDPGISNTNEGPDFFNAKVKIGDKVWAGNIEIHTLSSDWNKHNHQTSKGYNSVILHIVKNVDCEIFDSEGRSIPQCQIDYPKYIDENYEFLIHSNIDVPCANSLREIDQFHLRAWMNSLLLERMERKLKDIEEHLHHFTNSWDDVFYILLSRNFGFGLNSDIFERLALSLPLNYLRRHGDNLVQIEALLFGQAGMLNTDKPLDDYHSILCKEYEFLKNKYELKALDEFLFKNMRTRPSAFPQIRIAQLAALLHHSAGLFSKITTTKDVGKIRLMLHINASEYWQTHYTFGQPSTSKSKFLGDSSLNIILINTVAPILFAYGRYTGDEELSEQAFNLLETIDAEKNSITKSFAKYGIPMSNAADSQACIQLKREYCEKRKCLYCRIGHKLLVRK